MSGVGRALRGLRAGTGSLATSQRWVRRTPECIRVTSPSFPVGTDLPARFTAYGERLSPALDWTGIPVGTASLVLLVEDADVPLPIALTHALLYNIPPTTTGLPEAAIPAMRRERMADGTVVGRNSLGALGWLPPSPPPGHGPHHYAFQVLALDCRPSWEWPAGRGAVLRAARGHVLGWGVLFGIAERS
jgi:Raf kinase inhibitor-like YbhB/YbcL family protein